METWHIIVLNVLGFVVVSATLIVVFMGG